MAAETSAESIAIDVNVSIGGAGETASRFTIAVNPTGATRRDLHRAVAEELRLTRLQRGYLRLVVPNEPKMNAPATPRELARLLAVEEPVRSEEVLGDRLVPGCWIYGACNVAYAVYWANRSIGNHLAHHTVFISVTLSVVVGPVVTNVILAGLSREWAALVLCILGGIIGFHHWGTSTDIGARWIL